MIRQMLIGVVAGIVAVAALKLLPLGERAPLATPLPADQPRASGPPVHRATTLSATRSYPESHLDRLVEKVNYVNITFEEALARLKKMTDIDMVIDWHAIESAGVRRDMIINVRVRNIPIRRLLRIFLIEAAGDYRLEYCSFNGTIFISTRERVRSHTHFLRVYDVRDMPGTAPAQGLRAEGEQPLATQSPPNTVPRPSFSRRTTPAPEDETVRVLVDIIRDRVDPDSWVDQASGGSALCLTWEGKFIVVQTEATIAGSNACWPIFEVTYDEDTPSPSSAVRFHPPWRDARRPLAKVILARRRIGAPPHWPGPVSVLL